MFAVFLTGSQLNHIPVIGSNFGLKAAAGCFLGLRIRLKLSLPYRSCLKLLANFSKQQLIVDDLLIRVLTPNLFVRI